MWTSSTERHLIALLVLALASGCASRGPVATGLETDGQVSRYAEQRLGGDAALSDAEHIPPVPHDPAVEGVAREAMPEYARALAAIRAGELQKALIMMQSLSARYPQLSGPLVNQGRIWLAREEFGEAEDALRRALDVNPRNPYAHNLLGRVLREQGRFDEARDHYQRALELDPKYARAHFNLGVLAELYLQDLQLALRHFRAYQSLQRQPDATVANWIADLERRAPAPRAVTAQQEVE